MCGIVCAYGPPGGLRTVLEALYLLEYRAPDSSGVGVSDENGRLAVRRAVGAAGALVRQLAYEPLYATLPRAYSPAPPGFSTRLHADLVALDAPQALSSALAPEPTQRAFRLLGAHVAAPARLDPARLAQLDRELAATAGAASGGWLAAWEAEVQAGEPGPAFAAALACLPAPSPAALPADALSARPEIVLGHGRWAMVGAVTPANAHPFTDHSGTRLVVENGSHNAPRMLALRAEQTRWFRARGLAPAEPVHRSENTTEVIVYEWERAYIQLCENKRLMDPPAEDVFAASETEAALLRRLAAYGVKDPEEAALRLALWRVRAGNAHACAFYSQRQPGRLYISSHHKPIALIRRPGAAGAVLAASDVNAGLTLWPGAQVEAAARRLEALRQQIAAAETPQPALQAEIESLLQAFSVEVVYLDHELPPGAGPEGGAELLAWVETPVGAQTPEIYITRYDGAPVAFSAQTQILDPALVGKGEHPTYTEAHLAEIPAIFNEIARAGVQAGQARLEGRWDGGRMLAPGVDPQALTARFGPRLENLRRLLLIGEGSSWRDAQAAAPLLRHLLPGVAVTVYRPVEALNLGATLVPEDDLALEISWSGTTDSLLKVDSWLDQSGLLRLGVTGRPLSDLGRRTAASAGVLDVRSGVEISVATVKGYHAILATLNLLAVWLAQIRADPAGPGQGELARLLDEFSLLLPEHLRRLLHDPARRAAIRQAAAGCSAYNKAAIIGDSPAAVEAELKIEELAQIVAVQLDFEAASLRGLIEGSALVDEKRRRTLFVINAASPAAQAAAGPLLLYLEALGLESVVHTTPNEQVAAWQTLAFTRVFISPAVYPFFQPLIDVLFFFEFAIGLAYARGLTPAEIDRPRNLAKSVTTTGAERRETVEARRSQPDELSAPDLAAFAQGAPPRAPQAGPARRARLNRTRLALHPALAQIDAPLPEVLRDWPPRRLVVQAGSEAAENAPALAAAAWQDILGVDTVVYRQFVEAAPAAGPETWLLRLRRAGAVLNLRPDLTLDLPGDLWPLHAELLGAYFLIGLAARAGRQFGRLTPAAAAQWRAALLRLPDLVAETLAGETTAAGLNQALAPYLAAGYDKVQVIGGGMDFAAAVSCARTLRAAGVMAEALYTDSAWHGPLATVGGPDADHDALIVILATDPLFQATALVDTQVYRTRHAPVLLVVPQGNATRQAVRGVDPTAVIEVPAAPRPLTGLIGAAFGAALAEALTAGRQD